MTMVNAALKSLALTAATCAAAAAQGQQLPDFSKVEIKTTQLADNFFTLEGQGGTISVLTGPDGVLLVDSPGRLPLRLTLRQWPAIEGRTLSLINSVCR
jgi:hypothetical protein